MLLLKNATVINGDGKSELRHGNILVDGDRIAAVTDRLSDCDKTGWEVIDCTGKIVIPGMITHHTHGLVRSVFGQRCTGTFRGAHHCAAQAPFDAWPYHCAECGRLLHDG